MEKGLEMRKRSRSLKAKRLLRKEKGLEMRKRLRVH